MAHIIKNVLSNYFTHAQVPWTLRIVQQWPCIMGQLHTKAYIEKIEGDMVIIAVADSCLLQELFLLSDLVCKKINETLEIPRIKRVRFKIATQSTHASLSSSYSQTACRENKQSGAEYVLSDKEQDALQSIDDVELKKALAMFLIRCVKEKREYG